eukprot:Rhum_TRINITY_DN6438_c0_g1::Rhum_TRINITY_DN6438_c0_g1_i1::g.19911::m.19911/K08062/RFXANK; regulatory factor X-associated ankyrin-containing protein
MAVETYSATLITRCGKSGGFEKVLLSFGVEEMRKALAAARADSDPHVNLMSRAEAKKTMDELNADADLATLSRSCKGGDIDTVKLCLFAGVRDRPDEKNFYRTVVDRCAQFGDALALEELLKWGANPHHPSGPRIRSSGPEDKSLMAWCASGGNLNGLILLAKKGLDTDVEDDEGFTPFLYAVQGGHYESAMFLYTMGADIKHKSNDGVNALTLVTTKHKNASLTKFIKNKFKEKPAKK